MPIYELSCPSCCKKTSFFVKTASSPFEPKCPVCGSADLVRVISSFAHHKSIETIHEESGEPSMFPSQDYYKDPRNIGRTVEERFQKMGMEMPAELQQKIQAAREGDLPEPLKELKSASPDTSYH